MKRVSIRACALAMLAAALGFVVSTASADVEGFKKNLDEAKRHVEQEDWDDARTSLELANVELEDVPDAEKAALTRELEAVGKSLTDGENVRKRQELLGRLKSVMTYARERVKDKRAFDERKAEFDAHMKSEEAALLTEKEKADFTKEMNTLAKVANAAGAAEAMRLAETQMKQAEERAPEVMSNLKENPEAYPAQRDAEGLRDELAALREKLDALDDGAKKKALLARHAKVAEPLEKAIRSNEVETVYKRLKEYWDQGADDLKGWQDETDSPTFEEYASGRGDGMNVLKSDKSERLVDFATRWLDGLKDNEQYQAVKDDPKVKALVDGIRKDRDTALATLTKKVEKVLAGAEAAPKLNEEQTREMQDFARDTISRLLEGTPQQAGFEERAKAVVARAEGMAQADEKATKEEEARMTKLAAENWPQMVAALKAADGSAMDPAAAKEGELYRFGRQSNRAGAEFDHAGQFDVILPVNGVPIAAKYDPAISKAIGEAGDKFGYSPHWFDECIIEITGRARVQQQEYSQVTERWHATFLHTNVPVGRVVAFRSGPIAATAAGGSIGGGGGAAPAAAASLAGATGAGAGSKAGMWTWRVLYLLAGLAAGAMLVMRAKPAVLAGMPPAGVQVHAAVAGHAPVIGVAFVALGLWWLLSGLVYRDLLPAAALTLAGLVLATDLLKARGIATEQHAARLAPLALPVGVACAALAVLHLWIGGLPLV